jgi:hypothetical protein
LAERSQELIEIVSLEDGESIVRDDSEVCVLWNLRSESADAIFGIRTALDSAQWCFAARFYGNN